MPQLAPLALLAGLVCFGALAGGCSRATGCPAGKTCLRYMAWGNPEQLNVERQFVAKFNRENPDLFVRLFTVPGSSYGQKMTTMLVSGTAPDVLRVDHYAFPSMQQKGYFVDLTELAAEDKTFDPSDFYTSAIEECRVNGRLYGLNVLYGGLLIYYNKDLFRKAGLDDPYAMHKRGEWTWEKLRECAKKMTRFEGRRPQVFGLDISGFPNTAPLIWSFGGELMTPDWQRSTVGSPEVASALQFHADLVWKDKAAPTPSQAANAAFTFESGKVGMHINWMGMTPRYRQVITNFDWDVVPLPRGPKGQGFVLKGNQLVVAKNSKHPRAAWRFIRFLTGKPQEMELYTVIRRAFPTRKAVAGSPEFLKTTLPPRNMEAFVETVEKGRPLPITERWSEWTQILNSELDNLYSGREKEALPILKRAEERINKALAEDPGF